MEISKIGGKAIYHKVIKNLHNFGYIKYEPSYNSYRGSFVYMFNFEYADMNHSQAENPEYKTMGSTFLNNDLEDITGGISWRMLKGKISVSTNSGFQRNNLKDDQLSSMIRVVGAINTTYTISKNLHMNATVSNFNSSSQLTQFSERTLSPMLQDSLYYLQVSKNYSLGINYNFGEGDVRNVLFTNTSMQNAHDSQENESAFYNVNAGYQINIIPKELSVSTSLNYNINRTNNAENNAMGPSLVLSKKFFEKMLKCTIASTALFNQLNGKKAAEVYSTKFMAGYTYAKKHTFSCDAAYVSRKAYTENNQSFNELRAGVLYSYSF